MSESATGRIKIEGDATSFNQTVQAVDKGLDKIEKEGKKSALEVAKGFKDSSIVIANNFLSLAGQIKGYIDSALNYIPEKMKLAADVERGNVAWLMLERQNKELFEAAQNTMEYSVGLLKVRDSIFVINDIMGKGINLNKKLYQDLIQTSTTAAIRLNKPVQSMIEQFVAMGTKMEDNSEEMKMLGIQINKDRIFEEFARQTGKAVEELTEAEKKTAFLSELLDKMNKKSTVSFGEVKGLTPNTQALETYNDTMIDLEERWAAEVSKIGVKVHEFFKERDNYRQMEIEAEEYALEKMGILLAGYTDEQKTAYYKQLNMIKESSFERIKATRIHEEKEKSLMIQMRNLHAANIQNHTSMERVEEQLTSLSKTYGQAEFPIKKLINVYKQLQEARTNQMKADIAEEQAIKDARVKDELIKTLKSHYDKVNEVEFKAFEDKAKWEKLKAETILKWTKMSVAEIKKEKDNQDKALFDKEKNALILAKVKSTNESLRAELESYYDKNNQTEFKTYEDKEAWEKRKADAIKKWAKMGTAELRKEKKEQDKILFGLENTKKQGETFDKQLEDEAAMYRKKLEQHKAYIESKMLLDDELAQHSLQQLQARDNVNISDANSVQELVGIYNKEIANFKEYAKIKKLDQEDLSGGLANITNRYIKKKQEIEEKDFEFEKQLKEQAKSFAINTANSLYNSLLADEEDAVQKAIANSMMQAGSAIYAAGLENIWIGFGKTLSAATLPAGLKQMAGGALQVGAGVGLGYVGKQLMPPGADTKSDSAKLENQMAQQDKKLSDESKIYMFPSEQKWLEEINRANKKIKR